MPGREDGDRADGVRSAGVPEKKRVRIATDASVLILGLDNVNELRHIFRFYTGEQIPGFLSGRFPNFMGNVDMLYTKISN